MEEPRHEHNPEHTEHNPVHHTEHQAPHKMHKPVVSQRKRIEIGPVRKKKSPVGKYVIGALIFVVLVAIVVAIIMFVSKAGGNRSANANDKAAVVNGEVITVGYLEEQYARVPPTYQPYISKSMLLNQTINEFLLLQEAKKQGVSVTSADVTKEIETAMTNAGITADQLDERLKAQNVTRSFLEELYQKQLTINKLLEKTVFPKLKVSDAEVEDYYNSRVHAAHILVETEDEANAIIKELGKVTKQKLAARFMELAKNRSIDPSAAENGGDLGEFGTGQMVQPFEEAAMALAENAYTKVPVQTQFGYHVILRLPMNSTLEDSSDQIREMLLTQKKSEAVPLYLEQLKNKATIEVLYVEPVSAQPAMPLVAPTAVQQ